MPNRMLKMTTHYSVFLFHLLLAFTLKGLLRVYFSKDYDPLALTSEHYALLIQTFLITVFKLKVPLESDRRLQRETVAGENLEELWKVCPWKSQNTTNTGCESTTTKSMIISTENLEIQICGQDILMQIK